MGHETGPPTVRPSDRPAFAGAKLPGDFSWQSGGLNRPNKPVADRFRSGVHPVTIFQFIPLRSTKTTGWLLSPFQNTRHVAAFDLEDSYWVPGISQQSQELKIRAREHIIRFCAEAADRHRGVRVGVRVNPAGSDCFRLDLDVVKVLRESLALEFLILPKVEKAAKWRPAWPNCRKWERRGSGSCQSLRAGPLSNASTGSLPPAGGPLSGA